MRIFKIPKFINGITYKNKNRRLSLEVSKATDGKLYWTFITKKLSKIDGEYSIKTQRIALYTDTLFNIPELIKRMSSNPDVAKLIMAEAKGFKRKVGK